MRQKAYDVGDSKLPSGREEVDPGRVHKDGRVPVTKQASAEIVMPAGHSESKKRSRSTTVTTDSSIGGPNNGEPVVIIGYRRSFPRQLLLWILTVLTLGLIQLVLYWRPDWRLKMTHAKCSLYCANKVFIQDEYNVKYVKSVKQIMATHYDTSEVSTVLYVVYKKMKYIFSEVQGTFVQLREFADTVSCASLYKYATGLKTARAEYQKRMFGANAIVIPVKPIWWLVLHELLNPFYVFQLYSCIVWFVQWYYLYTSAIILLSIMSICVTVYETRKQSRALRDQVKNFSSVKVYRDREWKGLSSTELVPGDVIEVPANGTIDCDAVLLDGVVIMNESMLTGESIPETKTPLPDDDTVAYSPATHKRHTLFCGTSVLQTSCADGRGARALVISTGFQTAKGQLMRSILYPKPVSQKLYNDGMKFCAVSGAMGVLVIIYSVVTYVLTPGTTAFETIINALDIITFVVPASLPAMLTIGTIYAQRRLEKAGIYCLCSDYINLSGVLDICCFDKTGTLTADELCLYELLPTSTSGGFAAPARSVNELGDRDSDRLAVAMALCHSLVKVDGQFVGDSLDVALFQASNWELVEATEELTNRMTYSCQSNYLLWPLSSRDDKLAALHGVVHQYPFSSEFQRMGVVVQRSQSHDLVFYLKGAPEKVAELCVSATVPENLLSVMKQYTRYGFRVIALAYKPLEAEAASWNWRKVARSEVERNLNFLGLCILRNNMKPGTVKALQALHAADIRTLMVTGDNLNTAVYVARECGMVAHRDHIKHVEATVNGDDFDRIVVTRTLLENDTTEPPEYNKFAGEDTSVECGPGKTHYALDGKTFEILHQHPAIFTEILQHATVFARMLPDQKGMLIEKLQDLNYRVGMCGDGANDCAALKTADTGVSLCNTEASVAAPFTSKTQDISCMPLLMREGRCALTRSFALFKSLFGACWVELIAVLILSWISNDMSDWQYLYIDLFVIVAPTLFFGYVRSCAYLSPIPPPQSLTSVETLLSLLSYIGIQTIFLSGMWIYLYAQPWRTEWTYDYMDVTSFENSTIFPALNIAILFPSVIFFYGPPYQTRIYTNTLLCICMLILTTLCLVVLFPPGEAVVVIFSLKLAPTYQYYFVIAMFGILNIFFSLFVENVLINGVCHTKLTQWRKKKRAEALMTVVEIERRVHGASFSNRGIQLDDEDKSAVLELQESNIALTATLDQQHATDKTANPFLKG